MALKAELVEREFVFDGKVLPDPGPTIPVERVREILMQDFPDITTASVVPEVVDGKKRYTFNRRIGDKG